MPKLNHIFPTILMDLPSANVTCSSTSWHDFLILFGRDLMILSVIKLSLAPLSTTAVTNVCPTFRVNDGGVSLLAIISIFTLPSIFFLLSFNAAVLIDLFLLGQPLWSLKTLSFSVALCTLQKGVLPVHGPDRSRLLWVSFLSRPLGVLLCPWLPLWQCF